MTAPHHCNRCDSRWWGERMCHATCCHRTFSGITSFDLHKPGPGCVNPARSQKFVEVRPEVWGTPSDERALERRAALRESRP